MLTAAILAGDESSRIGANKALLLFRGHPMISTVADAVQPVASELFIVADDGAPHASLGFRTVADMHEGCLPLGRLHAALTASRTDQTLLLACDMPRVSTSLLRTLSEFPFRALARVAEIDGRIHPLRAVYDKRCLPEIERLITADRLAMSALLDAVGAQAVSITPDLSGYRSNVPANINDPSALHGEESAG